MPLPGSGGCNDGEELKGGMLGRRIGWIGMVYLMSRSSRTVLRCRMNAVLRSQRPPQSCQFGRSKQKDSVCHNDTRNDFKHTLYGNNQPDGILEFDLVDV